MRPTVVCYTPAAQRVTRYRGRQRTHDAEVLRPPDPEVMQRFLFWPDAREFEPAGEAGSSPLEVA